MDCSCNSHVDHIGDTVLESAENKEWDTDDDAKDCATLVQFDRNIHQNATEERLDEKARREIPGRNLRGSGVNQFKRDGTVGKAEQIAGSKIAQQDEPKLSPLLVFEYEPALPGK